MHCDLINRIIDVSHSERYLEVGVSKGMTFHKVNAARKTGVDPSFKFDIKQHVSESEAYFCMESDHFFRQSSKQVFDVIFLDGLHTFEQTLRDFLNSLEVAHARTVWIIDDTVPSDRFAAVPDQQKCYRLREEHTGSIDRAWMGDVFKVIFFVRVMMPAFRFWTVDGGSQTILWRERQPNPVANCPLEWIQQASFDDFCNRPELMNYAKEDDIIMDMARFMRSSDEH